jgi:hypothetical protein
MAERRKHAIGRKTQRIIVVYESVPLRERAVQFCAELPFASTPHIAWFSLSQLTRSGSQVVELSFDADLLIFATEAAGDFSQETKLWIEQWLNRRGEREGALVGLFDADAGPGDMAPFREIYLRNIARRAGMDYLTHARPTAPRAIPNSLDSYSERAGQITAVLDNILNQPPRPSSPPL